MLIKSIMSRSVITGKRNTPLVKICRLMKEKYIGSVVIVEGRRPVGIVTERDIVNAVVDYGDSIVELNARDIMKAPVFTQSPETEIHTATESMKNRRIRRIPVTRKDRIVGIVTYGDILRFMKKELADSHVQVKKLKGEVDRDGLTGVFTQKYFRDALKREVKRVKRYGGSLSLLMIDIDHFKDINDTYGHDAGDLVLVRIVSLIRENVRDINIICRYGGDEFAVIAPISDVHGAQRMGERLRKTAEKTVFTYKRKRIKAMLSIGIASWSSTMKTGQGLIIAADQALYKSKHNGRNIVSFI